MRLLDRLFSVPPESPCRKICRLDAEIRLCLGCWRTPTEIANWNELSARAKHAVLAELPRRERQHEARR